MKTDLTKQSEQFNQLTRTSEQKEEIQASLILAHSRTGLQLPERAEVFLNGVVKAIDSEFPKMKHDEILLAIKKGSYGAYGATYRMSIQEVCIWIREYRKSKAFK